MLIEFESHSMTVGKTVPILYITIPTEVLMCPIDTYTQVIELFSSISMKCLLQDAKTCTIFYSTSPV